ncbi:WD repeat-containing protein on Y chromosome isoform X2 [Hetaerina americana]|uniref:WD repeat-containing protein on Y chromosome isoform X2 n=1 Tax=Hetaerina americana TaxID=62018 RepID=UPI003A7F32ED
MLDKKEDQFDVNSKNNIMTKAQFKEVIEKIMKTPFPDDEYNIFFMRMDEKRNSAVDWDEFVSRMIIELHGEDAVLTKEMRQPPINHPPLFQSSGHRHPITRILFFPAVKQDKTPESADGRFVTLSKDGTINFWSPSFEHEKTCYCKSNEKRVHPTWVTDMVCLPDINMIGISSTERNLRFYDTMAMRFELRIVITSFEKAVTCMAYHMGSTSDGISHIVTGDMGGHVRIFSFGKGLIIEGRAEVKAGARGPFSFTAGDDVKVYHYKAIKKGILPLLLVTEYLESHPGGEWVKQVAFCPILRSFISCCGSSSEKSLVLRDVRTSIKVDYVFNVPHGVHCFAVNEARFMLATGGSDCAVRIWNAYVPNKAVIAFTGHHAAICGVEFMEGYRILSMSSDKCIKIWGIGDASCIQTYNQLTSEIGEHTRLAVYFHHGFKKLIVGSSKIAFIPYGPQEDESNKDGTTHFQSVTKALYNTLFKCLVTVGNDSAIMIWDVWTGKCSSILTEAHTRMEYGLQVPIEITAAAFDPISQQLLITGARDGTLKIWNFNSGLCIRHMSIERNCEVTSVLWLQNRILAVGWNRHITEFADLDSTELVPDENRRGSLGSTWPTIPRCAAKYAGSNLAEKFDGKQWETRHSEDVVCAVANPPQSLATGSYNGELILWRLETAQPYRQYHVGNPLDRVKLDFKKTRPTDNEIMDNLYTNETSKSTARSPRFGTTNSKKSSSHISSRMTTMVWCHCISHNPPQGQMKQETDNQKESISDYGFLGSFLAIHSVGDYVVTMTTDQNNEYLFTGDSAGYLKVWLLKNYFASNPQPKIVMPMYRLQFPFLLRDRWNGKAKRAIKGQDLPILLSSHQAHLRAITHIEYISEGKIIVSCSSDCSVRVWTLGGRYIGTLGQNRPWPDLEHGKEVDNMPLRTPYDVAKVASFTTMKVLNGANIGHRSHSCCDIIQSEDAITDYDLKTRVYGRRANKDHPLGTYFKLPKRSGKVHPPPKIDRSYGFLVPAYEHIHCPHPGKLELTTPLSVVRIQKQREMTLEQDMPAVQVSSKINENSGQKKPKKSSPCARFIN